MNRFSALTISVPFGRAISTPSKPKPKSKPKVKTTAPNNKPKPKQQPKQQGKKKKNKNNKTPNQRDKVANSSVVEDLSKVVTAVPAKLLHAVGATDVANTVYSLPKTIGLTIIALTLFFSTVCAERMDSITCSPQSCDECLRVNETHTACTIMVDASLREVDVLRGRRYFVNKYLIRNIQTGTSYSQYCRGVDANLCGHIDPTVATTTVAAMIVRNPSDEHIMVENGFKRRSKRAIPAAGTTLVTKSSTHDSIAATRSWSDFLHAASLDHMLSWYHKWSTLAISIAVIYFLYMYLNPMFIPLFLAYQMFNPIHACETFTNLGIMASKTVSEVTMVLHTDNCVKGMVSGKPIVISLNGQHLTSDMTFVESVPILLKFTQENKNYCPAVASDCPVASDPVLQYRDYPNRGWGSGCLLFARGLTCAALTPVIDVDHEVDVWKVTTGSYIFSINIEYNGVTQNYTVIPTIQQLTHQTLGTLELSCSRETAAYQSDSYYYVFSDDYHSPPVMDVCRIYSPLSSLLLAAKRTSKSANLTNIQNIVRWRDCDAERCSYDATTDLRDALKSVKEKSDCYEASVSIDSTGLKHPKNISVPGDLICRIRFTGLATAPAPPSPCSGSVTADTLTAVTENEQKILKVKLLSSTVCQVSLDPPDNCAFRMTAVKTNDLTVVAYDCYHDAVFSLYGKTVTLVGQGTFNGYVSQALHVWDKYTAKLRYDQDTGIMSTVTQMSRGSLGMVKKLLENSIFGNAQDFVIPAGLAIGAGVLTGNVYLAAGAAVFGWILTPVDAQTGPLYPLTRRYSTVSPYIGCFSCSSDSLPCFNTTTFTYSKVVKFSTANATSSFVISNSAIPRSNLPSSVQSVCVAYCSSFNYAMTAIGTDDQLDCICINLFRYQQGLAVSFDMCAAGPCPYSDACGDTTNFLLIDNTLTYVNNTAPLVGLNPCDVTCYGIRSTNGAGDCTCNCATNGTLLTFPPNCLSSVDTCAYYRTNCHHGNCTLEQTAITQAPVDPPTVSPTFQCPTTLPSTCDPSLGYCFSGDTLLTTPTLHTDLGYFSQIPSFTQTADLRATTFSDPVVACSYSCGGTETQSYRLVNRKLTATGGPEMASTCSQKSPGSCDATTGPIQWNYMDIFLASEAYVTSVVLYNRVDCCRDRLENIFIDVGEVVAIRAPFNPLEDREGVKFVQTKGLCYASAMLYPLRIGRLTNRVRLLQESNSFALSEVVIFGYYGSTRVTQSPLPPPPDGVSDPYAISLSHVSPTCTCSPGYTGDDCSSKICTVNCTNGACVDGVCLCSPGWSGSNCSTPFCGKCVHGTCDGTVCVCRDGYTGTTCESSDCEPECVHGTCVANSTGTPYCHCQPYFYGMACDHLNCTNCTGNCVLGDGKMCTPVGPYCECPAGKYGTDCSLDYQDSTCPFGWPACALWCSTCDYDISAIGTYHCPWSWPLNYFCDSYESCLYNHCQWSFPFSAFCNSA